MIRISITRNISTPNNFEIILKKLHTWSCLAGFVVLLFSPIAALAESATHSDSADTHLVASAAFDWFLLIPIAIGMGIVVFFWLAGNSLKIVTKMIGLTASLISLTVLITVTALTSMSDIGEELMEIAEEDIPLMEAISHITIFQLEQDIWLERAAQASGVNTEDSERLYKAQQQFNIFAKKVDQEIKKAKKKTKEGISLVHNEIAVKEYRLILDRLQDIEEEHSVFNRDGERFFSLLRDEQMDDALILLRRMEVEDDKLTYELEALLNEIDQFTIRSAQAAETHELTAERNLMILVVAGIILSMILSFMIVKSIIQSLNIAVHHASEMADGNLTEVIKVASRDEVGLLLEAMKVMQGRLEESVVTIKDSSGSVVLAAQEIAEESSNLSQRTQEQAASLEEISSSIEEISSTVAETANNAVKAGELVEKSREQTGGVNELVDKAVVAMNEINDSSEQIGQINSVINEIAFQTNLLALNAAVEAARAGEQGRGFAVVAGEVRNLAGRCQTAAKEINDLIDDSVRKVKAGTKLVGDTGNALSEIVTSISQVSKLVQEVKSANAEQSTGLGQIAGAITSLDDLVQHNAASVEESASAAEVLLTQTHALDNLVAYFKTTEDAGKAERKEESIEPRHQNVKDGKTRSWTSDFVPARSPALAVTGSAGVNLHNEDWQEF